MEKVIENITNELTEVKKLAEEVKQMQLTTVKNLENSIKNQEQSIELLYTVKELTEKQMSMLELNDKMMRALVLIANKLEEIDRKSFSSGVMGNIMAGVITGK